MSTCSLVELEVPAAVARDRAPADRARRRRTSGRRRRGRTYTLASITRTVGWRGSTSASGSVMHSWWRTGQSGMTRPASSPTLRVQAPAASITIGVSIRPRGGLDRLDDAVAHDDAGDLGVVERPRRRGCRSAAMNARGSAAGVLEVEVVGVVARSRARRPAVSHGATRGRLAAETTLDLGTRAPARGATSSRSCAASVSLRATLTLPLTTTSSSTPVISAKPCQRLGAADRQVGQHVVDLHLLGQPRGARRVLGGQVELVDQHHAASRPRAR